MDEIGELPLELQPKLLSAIQDRSITRVGGHREQAVDVRLIAATNRDLHEAVGERLFREDLLYRLNVLTLEISSLQTRPDDIPPLARHALGRITRRLGMAPVSLEAEAVAALTAHNWPGNVRELENVLERAVVFAKGNTLGVDDLGTLRVSRAGPADTDLVGISIAELEKRAIISTLAAFGGNRAEAAKALGIRERTIYNRLKDYGREAGTDPSGEDATFG